MINESTYWSWGKLRDDTNKWANALTNAGIASRVDSTFIYDDSISTRDFQIKDDVKRYSFPRFGVVLSFAWALALSIRKIIEEKMKIESQLYNIFLNVKKNHLNLNEQYFSYP